MMKKKNVVKRMGGGPMKKQVAKRGNPAKSRKGKG